MDIPYKNVFLESGSGAEKRYVFDVIEMHTALSCMTQHLFPGKEAFMQLEGIDPDCNCKETVAAVSFCPIFDVKTPLPAEHNLRGSKTVAHSQGILTAQLLLGTTLSQTCLLA